MSLFIVCLCLQLNKVSVRAEILVCLFTALLMNRGKFSQIVASEQASRQHSCIWILG